MDTRILYEASIQRMYALFEENVQGMSGAYLALKDDFQAMPLFSITSPELILLKSVSRISNYQIRNEMANLCRKLCETFGLQTFDSDHLSNIDFFVCHNGHKTGYSISMNEDYLPELDVAIAEGMDQHITVILKQHLTNCSSNHTNYRKYRHKDITSKISLEEFFKHIHPEDHPKEFEIFKEYIGRFNYDAELLLGLNITPKPTKRALSRKWEKIKNEFENGFFNPSLTDVFNSDELKVLWQCFKEKNILQLSRTSFVDSFVSSEWYYDLWDKSSDGDLEQTAIVAGYLKSIEQLLFSLMLSRCNELRFKLWRRQEPEKLERLTKENQHQLQTMAGSLLKSINKNYVEKRRLDNVFISETIGRKVLEYLDMFIKETRNGYFHKDNIYTPDEIRNIRTKAYCAYFLLCASFVYEVDQIES